MFIDGYQPGSVTAPASVEEPTYDQRIAVHRDRTAHDLREMGPKLGLYLPVRDKQLGRATTLLEWLRGARSAPPPLRIVLCDRVVESVAGWAGIASPAQFIADQLLPWWAYGRMRTLVMTAAYALWDCRPSKDMSAERWSAVWEEIKNHEPLQIHPYPDQSISLRGVLSESQWLLKRLPADSQAAERLTELDRLTRTGQAAAAWWNRLCDHAGKVEKRRSRTRNALMHGGPLAPGTVTSVAEFADNLASEALAACIEGMLLGQDSIDYFLDRRSRAADMRARLSRGDAPPAVLFAEAPT